MHKELELRRSEIQELSRTKEKLSARVEELEQQVKTIASNLVINLKIHFSLVG